jgi:hypothetical protein
MNHVETSVRIVDVVTERMTCWIEQHAYVLPWLERRDSCTKSDSIGNRCVQILHLDIHVHHHAPFAGPGLFKWI